MGYRSDVAYTIRFKTEADYRLFILEAKADPLKAMCFTDGECELDDARFRITFTADDIKWYDSFPEVQMHDRLIEQAADWCNDDDHQAIKDTGQTAIFSGRDYRLGYVFVRVGEDESDNERKDGGFADYDWVYMNRTIEWG